MIVEELIGKLGFKVDGLDKMKAAEKAMERLKASLKGASSSLRSGLSVPATGIDRLSRGLDKSTAAARRLRREADLAAVSVRRAAGAGAGHAPGRGARGGVPGGGATGGIGPGPGRRRGVVGSAVAGAGAVRAGVGGVLGMGIGAYAGGALLKKTVTDYASAERAITRIGITAEATDEEIKGVGKTAHDIAQQTAQPYHNVVEGLDTLVAQGRNLKEAMAFLPAVAKTAQAAGAEVTDIAKSADAVATHFKIPADEMQKAFDEMATAGKLGQFELKDMARYLPSIAAMAKAAGFEGTKGIADLTAMLQVMRKGAGTSEEAADSMINVLQKMESETTLKKLNEALGGDGKAEAAFKAARANGENLVVTFEKLARTATKGDLSKIPQLFNDLQFARGARALLSQPGQWEKFSAEIGKAAGTVEADLGRVTKNTQANLDQMNNELSRTSRELGSLISIGAVPALKQVGDSLSNINDDVERARNGQTTNTQRNARSVWNYLTTGQGVDQPGQELARAHADKMRRDAVDARKSAIDSEIEGLGRAAPLHKGSIYADSRRAATEKRIESLKAEKVAIDGAVAAYDEVNMKIVDNAAGARRVASVSMGKEMTGAPIIAGGGATFGLRGAAQLGNGAPKNPPAPPARPTGLPAGLDRIESILSGIETKAQQAGKTMQDSLNVTVTPTVETSSLDAFIAKVEAAKAAISSLGSAVAGASSRIGGAGLVKGSNATTGAVNAP